MQAKRLDQMLLHEGVLQRGELEAALAASHQQQKRFAQTLLEMNLIEEHDLARFLSRETGFPLVDPLPNDLPTWVYRRIPGPIARTYQAAPLDVVDRRITVALLDPTDQSAIDVLTTATQMTITPAVAVRSSLEKLLNRVYPVDLDVDATIVSERNFPEDSSESTDESVADETEPDLDTMSIEAKTIDLKPQDFRKQLDEIWRAIRALRDEVRALRPKP